MRKSLPIAILLPHAGLMIPPELEGRSILSPAQIFNEADAWAEQLFDFRAQVQHWEFFPYARALIDVNRPPDDAAHHRSGDGAVKIQTSYGDPVYEPGNEPDPHLHRQLMTHYWSPWHRRLAAIAADPTIKLVIDAHTMAAHGPATYDDPHALRPRVMVANLGDAQGQPRQADLPLTAPPPLLHRFKQHLEPLFADLPALAPTGDVVGINFPFWGGWDLRGHPQRRQPWLMIELSRALYIGPQTAHTPVPELNSARLIALRELLWQAITTLYSEL